VTEAEPTTPQFCDSCKRYFDYWLNYLANLGLSICEDCMEDARLERNNLRFGIKNEA
jgi:hypothetical protein